MAEKDETHKLTLPDIGYGEFFDANRRKLGSQKEAPEAGVDRCEFRDGSLVR
ncbi:hypothetical protein HYV30_00835 [Candidatus Kaiserbacteria bacterium]|nr:hypothetical protein [Candidatus Kaiserbacteria bacterium]